MAALFRRTLVTLFEKDGRVGPGAFTALTEHSAGNRRSMMLLGQELLQAAVVRDARQIDEKLFFEVCAISPPPTSPSKKRR